MGNGITQFLQRLRRSALLRGGEEDTDGQLLEKSVRRNDRQALERLVRRHAPLVWGVCRRTLANQDDAEDAFQATFLVLVRRAASIRSPELLPNWLYRVAFKTARKARQIAAKRAIRERQVVVMPEPQMELKDYEFAPEVRALLDEELSRLADKYRVTVLLCDLEGRTRQEVARQLGLPEGTVASRLARGRALLANRLVRRGVTFSATFLAATLSQQAASGSVPAGLMASTVEITAGVAVGEVTTSGAVSAHVSSLVEGTLKTMALATYRTAGIFLLIASVALCGGFIGYRLWFAHRTGIQDKLNEIRLEHDTKEDDTKFGSDTDARHYAERVAMLQLMSIQNVGEGARWSLQFWTEPTANRYSQRIPQSKISELDQGDPGAARNCGSCNAKLDRERGEWIVNGIGEIGPPAPNAAWEVDWKLIVHYAPSTGSWNVVSGGWNGFANAENVGGVTVDGFLHPIRYGWRPVGKNDDKGSKGSTR